MTANYSQATDDILTMFKTAWDTTGYFAIYPNTKGTKPPTRAPWARVTINHVTGGEVSIAGALGTQRFGNQGFIIVQIFVPAGEGLDGAKALAKTVVDAYAGKASPNQVWFRNGRLNEVGPDGDWYQVNVIVDFTYDEVK